MKAFDKYGLYIHSISKTISLGSKKNQPILAQLLDYWHDPEDIKEDVLPDIDKLLNGETDNEGEISSDVIGVAYFDAKQTHVGNSSVGYLDLILPTEDFKELWLEWIDILEKHEKTKQPWGYVPTSWDEERVEGEINYAKEKMFHLFGNTYESLTTDDKMIKLIIQDGVLRRISAASAMTGDYSKKVELPIILIGTNDFL